jgi:hypothetical protein
MSGKDETPKDTPDPAAKPAPPRPTQKERREAELALALRANLRRRKGPSEA